MLVPRFVLPLHQFLKLMIMGEINYGDLYEHLCSAQYIADVLQDEHANQIMTIRQEVGEKLLKIHEDNAKC